MFTKIKSRYFKIETEEGEWVKRGWQKCGTLQLSLVEGETAVSIHYQTWHFPPPPLLFLNFIEVPQHLYLCGKVQQSGLDVD